MIRVLERNEARMVRNVHECAFGTLHECSTFSSFVREFPALPSGMCPPERDHHIVGAELTFSGATADELTSLMEFFADERFIKPGLGTALAVTIVLPVSVDEALCSAVRRTLNDGQQVVWPMVPRMIAAYFSVRALFLWGRSAPSKV